jgi:hypothetical protein
MLGCTWRVVQRRGDVGDDVGELVVIIQEVGAEREEDCSMYDGARVNPQAICSRRQVGREAVVTVGMNC